VNGITGFNIQEAIKKYYTFNSNFIIYFIKFKIYYIMKKNECLHKNRKNLDSYKIGRSNLISVICIDCGASRIETRFNNGRIDTSKWFNKK
jgi:hypothetical protein